MEVGLASGHGGQPWASRGERSHSAVGSHGDGMQKAAVAPGAPQDIAAGSRALHVQRRSPKGVIGSAATHRSAIEVERRSCQTSSTQDLPDTAVGPERVWCSRGERSPGEVVPVDLDVRGGGRGKVMAAAVGCKQEVVATHGSNKCGKAVREGAAAAAAAAVCDARASVTVDRCTNPVVDVFPRGLFRPSHALVNRKSICSDRQQDHAYRPSKGLTASFQPYDSDPIIWATMASCQGNELSFRPTKGFDVCRSAKARGYGSCRIQSAATFVNTGVPAARPKEQNRTKDKSRRKVRERLTVALERDFGGQGGGRGARSERCCFGSALAFW